MAAGGTRTVKIRFTGESKGLDRTARNAEKSLERFGSNAKAALSTGLSGIGDVISGALKTPYVGAAVAAAGVAIAAIFSSALGAALVSGAGIAAVALPLAIGIKAASNDPAVKAAFGEFTKKGKAILEEFGAPFRGPLIRAAETFGQALDKMRPTFMAISKEVAPIVDLLAPAFANMAVNSLPGIHSLIKAATPFFQVIADKAPALGTAISQFMEKIAEGGPGAQKFLEDVMNFLIWVIPKVGAALGWLSNYYITWRNGLIRNVNAVRAAWNAFYGFFSAIGSRIGTAIGRIIVSFNNFRNRVAGVWSSITGTIGNAVNRIEGWWNRLRNLASSAINFSIGGFSIPGLSGARAAGGPVGAGRSYLVGERGPEILTMGGRSGYITPNHQISGGGGPDILELTLNLAEGIREVVQINLREHDRNTKRRVAATRRA